MDECGGKLNALLVAVGQSLHRIIDPIPQAEPVEPEDCRLPGIRLRHTVKPTQIGELVTRSHLRVKPALFGHVPEPKQIVGTYRLAVPCHCSGVGVEETKDGPHRRRLPGAVGSQKAQHVATSDFETATREGAYGSERLV